jgi:RHS repeat-associated protein
MTDAGGTEHFSYDPLGREWVEQRTTNGYTYKTSYSYNLDGSMASMTYPSGRTINYTLDSAGRPSIAQDQNGTTYASGDCSNGTTGNGTCYAPTGGVSQVQYGSNLVSTLIYNSRLQPCWLYATTNSSILSANSGCSASDPGPGNILDLSYIFNLGSSDNGNVMGITNNANNSRSQLFAYDTLNRIIMAGTPETSGTNCWGETYSYDAWANLTAIGAQAGYSGCTQESGMSIAIASGTNQVSSFSYDASGNTLNDTVNTYTWNAESEMSSSDSSVNYIYDGDGDRLEKSDGKMYWYGAGAEILDESNLSGSFTNEYVFFGGKRIAMLSGGNVYYYAEDFLGSTSKMVQSGQMSACFDADYYPFGGQRIYTNSCTPVYQFEGKERDTETGNDDFGARYYSWRFGRWESADWSSVPVAVPYATLANPQTLNLYAMVADNPETDADLDGHYWDICHNAYDCSGVVSTSAGSESDPEDANNEASNPQQMSTNQEQQKEQQQAQQQQATANSVVNKLSVGQIAAIVYNETASLSNSGSQNDSIDAARTDVATSIINADVEYGDNRGKVAGTAPDTVSKAVIKTSAYKSSLGAAEAAYVAWKAGKDPTGGATHFNLRGNDSTANFQRSRTNSGFAIKTHSGPFNNSFPTPGLPKTGVYVNTYE